MRRSAAESKISTIIALALAVLAFLTPFLVFTMYTSRSNEGEGGATGTKAFDITNAAGQKVINELTGAISPEKAVMSYRDYLVYTGNYVDRLELKIKNEANLGSDVKERIANIIIRIRGRLSRVSRMATELNQDGQQNTEIMTVVDANDLDILKINMLSTGNELTGNTKLEKIINFAKKIVQENNDGAIVNNGRALYPYTKGGYTNLSKGVDCSGFMSYLLIKNGLLTGHSTTVTFPYVRNYQHLNTDSTGTKMVQSCQQNNWRPGDLIITKSRVRHIVMYIGPSCDATNNVIHSTGKRVSGKDGPQYGSLSTIARWRGLKVLNVLRPPYDLSLN